MELLGGFSNKNGSDWAEKWRSDSPKTAQVEVRGGLVIAPRTALEVRSGRVEAPAVVPPSPKLATASICAAVAATKRHTGTATGVSAVVPSLDTVKALMRDTAAMPVTGAKL